MSGRVGKRERGGGGRADTFGVTIEYAQDHSTRRVSRSVCAAGRDIS